LTVLKCGGSVSNAGPRACKVAAAAGTVHTGAVEGQGLVIAQSVECTCRVAPGSVWPSVCLCLQADKKTSDRFTPRKLWHSNNHRDW
jgi:hypothetical protein